MTAVGLRSNVPGIGLRLQIVGAERGEVRTVNMLFMSVTREVSQLSGWLKTFAYCRGLQGSR